MFKKYFRCQECSWYTTKIQAKIITIFPFTVEQYLSFELKYPITTVCARCGACDWTIDAGSRLVEWWNPFTWLTRKMLWRSEVVKLQELKKKQELELKKHEELVEMELNMMRRKKSALKGIDDDDYVGIEPGYGPY